MLRRNAGYCWKRRELPGKRRRGRSKRKFIVRLGEDMPSVSMTECAEDRKIWTTGAAKKTNIFLLFHGEGCWIWSCQVKRRGRPKRWLR